MQRLLSIQRQILTAKSQLNCLPMTAKAFTLHQIQSVLGLNPRIG